MIFVSTAASYNDGNTFPNEAPVILRYSDEPTPVPYQDPRTQPMSRASTIQRLMGTVDLSHRSTPSTASPFELAIDQLLEALSRAELREPLPIVAMEEPAPPAITKIVELRLPGLAVEADPSDAR